MRYLLGLLILMAAAVGFFSIYHKNDVEITKSTAPDLTVPEAPRPTSTLEKNQNSSKNKVLDIEPQSPLVNPPEEIRAIYLTSWSAGSPTKIDNLINFVKIKNLDAVVIDVKDYSGYVSYDIQNADVIKYEAKEIRIPRVNTLIKKLHDQNIYAIARITVFQDPRLAKARPELAIRSISKGRTWTDRKGLAWIDPSSREAWDYNVAIAKDAASRGFDEINFDYIRFASDGNLADMKFPSWDGKTLKPKVIRSFFKYLREQLPDVKISADLFGLSTISENDLGIGQVIEDAYVYFDYVSPMVYPSHFASGTLGYKNPAQHPYEIIKYSLDGALKRIKIMRKSAYSSSTVSSTAIVSSTKQASSDLPRAKLRPWLQNFDLGAVYDNAMIGKEIQAVTDVLTGSEYFNGWMLWDPSNIYKGYKSI